MKKAGFILIFTVFLGVFLTGCGEDSPIEKAQKRAVEIGEQYLNYEITAAEAKEMLDSIVVPETEGNGQIYLSADIGALGFSIIRSDASYEDILLYIERLKTRDYTE